MTNAEATITENAATIAEQGAHVAPEKAASKKVATQKKGAPKRQKTANFRIIRLQAPSTSAAYSSCDPFLPFAGAERSARM